MSQFTNEDVVSGTVDANITNSSIAVTGPITDAQLRATPVPVTIPTPVPITQGGVATAAITRVSVSPTVTTLKAANAARAKLILYNEGGTLYVKYGTGASSTDYTTVMTANTVLFVDSYTGIITGTKNSGTTSVQVTEIA